MFNPNVKALTAPPVAAVLDWIQSYDGRHGDLINLSQAVPGYPPHADLIAAIADAAKDPAGFSYGAVEGDDELRDAYARHVSQFYKANITASEVMITSGCNQAFITAIMAIAGSGDKVLMAEPCYFNHDLSLKMLGISTGYIKTDPTQNFIPKLEDISALMTKEVKAIALVSPNNPTGAIYPKKFLSDVLALCQQHGIWLLLDETYRDFIPTQDPPHSLLGGAWHDSLMLLYSFSKAYCISGHRLGAVVASPAAIAEMAKILDNIQICAPRMAQIALAPMLDKLADWRAQNNQEMALRADAFKKTMAETNTWQIESLGAYFGYVRHPFGAMSSTEVAKTLTREAGVLTIPGDFFGENQQAFIRFAFANADIPTIEMIAPRLAKLNLG